MFSKLETLELLKKINKALTDAHNIWDRIEKDSEGKYAQPQKLAA